MYCGPVWRHSRDISVQKWLKMNLTAVVDFLKFGYSSNVRSENEVVCNNHAQFYEQESHSRSWETLWVYCFTTFCDLKDICRNALGDWEDAIRVLEDASIEFWLFPVHQLRCSSQEQQIARVFNLVKVYELCFLAVVLMDYKIGFGLTFSRSRTT